MNDISGFTIFRSYHEAIKELPKKDRGEVLIAILNFVFEDKEPNFTGYKKMAWELIKPTLIKSKNKSKNARKSKSNKNQFKIKLKSNKKQIKISGLLYPLSIKNILLNNYILEKGDYKGKKPFKLYGSQKNVKLKDEELQKLKERFTDYETKIENLSLYIASTGKKYKSHYATILNWSRNEKGKKKSHFEEVMDRFMEGEDD